MKASEGRVLVEGPAVQLVAGTEATKDWLLAKQKKLKQENVLNILRIFNR